MRYLELLLDYSRKISLWGALFGGSLLIVSVVIIGVEVILRKGFGRSLGGADELSSYALAIGASWAFAYALFERNHIRVDVVYARLGRRTRAVLDLISLLVLGVVIYLLARYAYDVFATSYVRRATANTPLGTPLWWPQGLWFLGLAWFLLVDALIFIRALAAWIVGDLDTIERIAGSHTFDEDLAEVESFDIGEE